MVNIIVALPRLEEAKSMKNILVRSGFQVTGICTTGAQAISQADGLHDGIVISGYKLEDMIYRELRECLPGGFEMLLLVSQRVLSECRGEGMVALTMPLKVNDLMNTLRMLSESVEYRRRKRHNIIRKRSPEEESIILEAKEMLMGRNHLTEGEAHRYLQKCSMDSGTGIVEAAQMVLLMMQ